MSFDVLISVRNIQHQVVETRKKVPNKYKFYASDLQISEMQYILTYNRTRSIIMGFYRVKLDGCKRRFTTPFPLSRVSTIDNHPVTPNPVSVKGTLELCIRLCSGEQTSVEWFDGVKYQIGYPNVAIKVPDVVHTFSVDTPRDIFSFVYDLSLYQPLKTAGFLDPPYCWDFQMTPELNVKFREMRLLMEHSDEFGTADRIDQLAITIFEELIFQRDRRSCPKDMMDAKIHKIISYLHLNFTRKIDLDKLLRENGFSRRSFYRYWNRNQSVTPAAYILDLRLEEAARLLRETALPIYTAARETGFASTAYFCRLFLQKYHLSPRRYRFKFQVTR